MGSGRSIFFLAAVFAWMVGGCSVAVADEVFICERNRIVRATPETLETLKRTDPCVAAHYGLIVPPRPEPATRAALSAKPSFTREIVITESDEPSGGDKVAPEARLRRFDPEKMAIAARLARLTAADTADAVAGKTSEEPAASGKEGALKPVRGAGGVKRPQPSGPKPVRLLNAATADL